MVRKGGLEPPCPCGRSHLKAVRLPISPLPLVNNASFYNLNLDLNPAGGAETRQAGADAGYPRLMLTTSKQKRSGGRELAPVWLSPAQVWNAVWVTGEFR